MYYPAEQATEVYQFHWGEECFESVCLYSLTLVYYNIF